MYTYIRNIEIFELSFNWVFKKFPTPESPGKHKGLLSKTAIDDMKITKDTKIVEILDYCIDI